MSIRQFHFYLGVTVRRRSNWNAWHVIESIRAFPAKVRPVIHLAHIIFTGPVFMYAPMLLSARGHDTSCDSQSVNSPTSQPASKLLPRRDFVFVMWCVVSTRSWWQQESRRISMRCDMMSQGKHRTGIINLIVHDGRTYDETGQKHVEGNLGALLWFNVKRTNVRKDEWMNK